MPLDLATAIRTAPTATATGEGVLKGKRALVSVLTGGPAADYGPRGINGPLEQLLFPLTHGALFYPGMDVLPLHAVYGAAHIATADEVADVTAAWRGRVERLLKTPHPLPSSKRRRLSRPPYPQRRGGPRSQRPDRTHCLKRQRDWISDIGSAC